MTNSTSTSTVPDTDIHALRAFNRFYTRKAGVLGPYLSSDLSLTDVRVLYELAHAPSDLVATDIARKLGHDNGYLSRILKRFENRGWIKRTPNPRDGRQSLLALTDKGREAFAPLDARSHAEAGAVLEPLSERERGELMSALETVQRLLGAPTADGAGTASASSATMSSASTTNDNANGAPAPAGLATSVTLRNIQPGDLGWVVQIHGALYHAEYGWDATFEALVAEIVADFARNHDPARERAWIAEAGGERVGCVFVVKGSAPTTAKLRLLCLTPAARGLGLGGRLVDEVLSFARGAGYNRVELWTHSCLLAARKIYARRGFELVKSEPYVGLGGHELVGEFWELDL